jgi:hypothetical protein
VLVLAAAHSLIAVAATATALGQPGVDAFSLLVVANAAATLALAAAQYLNLYVRAVRLRERAVTTRRQIETRNAASRAVQEDAAHRLQALQAEVIPLLTDVAIFARNWSRPAAAVGCCLPHPRLDPATGPADAGLASWYWTRAGSLAGCATPTAKCIQSG